MAQEIEAKFRVDDDMIFTWLLRLSTFGQFRLVPQQEPERQRNTYFDSPDGHLEAAGYSLRVREVDLRRVATLKRTRSRQGNLRIRDEWEVAIGRSDLPRDWPDGEVRARVLETLRGAEIFPLFVVTTHRLHICALREGRRVADLCLDAGLIHAGALGEPFRELEVELLDARERPAFDALVGLLRLSFPLFPEERSKKARGLALLARSRMQAHAVGG